MNNKNKSPDMKFVYEIEAGYMIQMSYRIAIYTKVFLSSHYGNKGAALKAAQADRSRMHLKLHGSEFDPAISKKTMLPDTHFRIFIYVCGHKHEALVPIQ